MLADTSWPLAMRQGLRSSHLVQVVIMFYRGTKLRNRIVGWGFYKQSKLQSFADISLYIPSKITFDQEHRATLQCVGFKKKKSWQATQFYVRNVGKNFSLCIKSTESMLTSIACASHNSVFQLIPLLATSCFCLSAVSQFALSGWLAWQSWLQQTDQFPSNFTALYNIRTFSNAT